MTTVTIVRSGPCDKYGDPSTDAPVRTTVTGCRIAPNDGADIAERGEPGTVDDVTVYMPSGVDIVATDGIEIDGVVWRISGSPRIWAGTRTGGILVRVTRGVG